MIIHNDISRFNLLQPFRFCYLKSLTILHDISSDEFPCQVEFTLSKRFEGKIVDMNVTCVNVKSIKVGDTQKMGEVLMVKKIFVTTNLRMCRISYTMKRLTFYGFIAANFMYKSEMTTFLIAGLRLPTR